MTSSASSIRVVPASGQAVTGVGKYRYIAMLAEGGMADVYLAVTQSAGFEKLVVIKQLRDTLAEDPSFVAMFMDEARLAARLNHPNVVQTLEVGTDAATGLHFIAMEFLEGVAHVRFARLKERIPPPLAFHVRILVDVLRGLHYAHELRDFDGMPLNVVHRDVSPQNVMLTFAGGVKVLDFGIAKAALAAEQRPEDFKGKLEYMAPEQARMEDVDRRADVFSVGVMLFEALSRRRLYRKGEDKLQMLIDGLLPDVLDVAPTAPKRLAAICARAMAHAPEARYATADAMADDLEEWLGSTTQHVSARDVGSYVADKFASTREKIGAAIEAQLARFRAASEDAPDTIPHLPVADFLPPELSDRPPPVSVPPGAMPPAFVGGVPPAFPGAMPPALPSAASLPGWSTGEGVPVHAIPPQQPDLATPRGRSTGAILAVLAIAGVVVLSGVVAIASRRGAEAPGAASAAAPPAVAASAPPGAPPSAVATAAEVAEEPPQIDFTIKASPPGARISIDGVPAGANPAVGKRPRDGAMHLIRVEAPGHDPREESIAFDRSVLVTIELRASAPAAEAPTPAPANTPKPAPPRPTRAPRPQTPGGKLDSENPYQ